MYKKYDLISKKIQSINKLEKNIQNIDALFKLSIKENENSLFDEIILDLKKEKEKIKKLEFYRIFPNQNDNSNCYIDLQAGSGGIEAQDWTKILMRMYLRYAELKGFQTKIIEILEGDVAGLKSATIKVQGAYSYGWLRTETGIHRLVRKSPFNANKKRHTSFSSVFVYPEIKDDINVTINLTDLRIDVYRSSGAGGQHVNKTESAIRITHIPTGIVTQCQNDRSQHKNKNYALKQLKSKLYELEVKKKQETKKKLEKNKSKIRWGNQIRSYILDDSRIKDLRTGMEIHDTQSVLNGNLEKFIRNNLECGL